MKGRICDALLSMICKIESEARENINHSSRAVRAREKKTTGTTAITAVQHSGICASRK